MGDIRFERLTQPLVHIIEEAKIQRIGCLLDVFMRWHDAALGVEQMRRIKGVIQHFAPGSVLPCPMVALPCLPSFGCRSPLQRAGASKQDVRYSTARALPSSAAANAQEN